MSIAFARTSPPSASRGGEARAATWRAVHSAVPWAWVVNAGLLLVAVAWIYGDGYARQQGTALRHTLVRNLGGAAPAAAVAPSAGIVSAAGLAALSGIVVGASLVVGSRRWRTLRCWTAFVALVAGWLALGVGGDDLAWYGQCRRLQAALPAASATLHTLRTAWPTGDGEIPGLGPVLAYPQGTPRTLMTLGPALLGNARLRCASVERTDDGAMRLELAGPEAGAWLEWRPRDDAPVDFVGGLGTSYAVQRQHRLSHGWFAVRYLTR